MKHKLPIIAVIWYITGLLLFHAKAKFGIPQWDFIYYAWEKTKDCLFLVSLYFLIPSYKKTITPIVFYSIVRLCFQIIGFYLKTGQNEKYIVTTLFLTALIITIYLTLKQLLDEWKQN